MGGPASESKLDGNVTLSVGLTLTADGKVGASIEASTAKVVDWNADKIARKCATIEVDPDLDIAALRAKAQGDKMTDEEKKERGLLYDTSKAAAVREESEDEDDEDACDMGGDPFEGL